MNLKLVVLLLISTITVAYCLDASPPWDLEFLNIIADEEYYSTQGSRQSLTNTATQKRILIKDCTFNCSSQSTSSLPASEASSNASPIYFTNADLIVIENTQFINCQSAWKGGALRVENATVQIVNSTFINNTAVFGGAIYAKSSLITIIGSSFSGNQALMGGAIKYEEFQYLTLTNVIIVEGHSQMSGSIIHSSSSSPIVQTQLGQQVHKFQNVTIQRTSQSTSKSSFEYDHAGLDVIFQDESQILSDLQVFIGALDLSSLSISNSEIHLEVQNYLNTQFINSRSVSKRAHIFLNNNTIEVTKLNFESTQIYQKSCIELDDEQGDLISSIIKSENGSIISENNQFSSDEVTIGSVYQIINGSLIDSSSSFINLTSFYTPVLLACSLCEEINVHNPKLDNVRACFSSSYLVNMNRQQGDATFSDIKLSAYSETNHQNLINLNQQGEQREISFTLQNTKILDKGTFETSLLEFVGDSTISNLVLRNISLEYHEYFPQILKVRVREEMMIQNISISTVKDMKQAQIYDTKPGILVIENFKKLSISQFNLACSSSQYSMDDILDNSSSHLVEDKPTMVQPVFQVLSSQGLSQDELCQLDETTYEWSNCDFNQILFDRVSLQRCYNFEDGVVLQCQNCQDITVRDSQFKSLSKLQVFSGGESGLFQFDENAKRVSFENSIFEDIVTEGAMLQNIKQRAGMIQIQNCSFS